MDFGFLSPNRKERAIIEGLLLDIDIVSRAVSSFEQSVLAAAKGDSAAAQTSVDAVFEAETQADTVHRELSLKVAEGAFFGGVREDILNLLEKIDDIADSAKDAARFLASDSRLGPEARTILGSENMRLFLGDLKSSVGALADLVRAFEKGKKEALSKVSSVEEFEQWADTRKDALIKELFDSAESMNTLTVIQLRDFVFLSDDIADNAEDASDVILVLIAKGYG